MKKKIDFTLIKILAVFYGVVVLLTLSKRIYFLYRDGILFNESNDWFGLIFSSTFLDWFLITLYMTIVLFLTKKMIHKNLKIKYIVLIHIPLAMLMTYFTYFFGSIIMIILGKSDLSGAISNLSFDHFVRYVDFNFVIYFVMTAIIYMYYYINKIRDVETQKILLLKQLALTKMKILQDQLHPHFLFNTLNSISVLVESNPKQAQNTIADLSTLLREILDLKEEQLITLKKEIALLKRYLDIMLVRFSDHLTININIDCGIEKALVPSMLIQPIVENSFKHGFSINTTELEFVLNIFRKEERLVIEISNNGNKIKQTINKNGYGLNNTKERLKTIYGDNFEFNFVNKLPEEKGVITTIIIPFEEG